MIIHAYPHIPIIIVFLIPSSSTPVSPKGVGVVTRTQIHYAPPEVQMFSQ